jgi:hypothetical protein
MGTEFADMPGRVNSKWFKYQWEQIRGNAKWDAVKLLWGVVMAVFIAIVWFLRSGPAWQVWMVVTLAVVAFLCFAFFNSRFGKIAAGICGGMAVVMCGVFALAFYHKQQVQKPSTQPNSITTGNNSPALNMSGSNDIRGPVINGNNNNAGFMMSANNATNLVIFTGGINNPQTPISAPGGTFNYYSAPISNSVTREAFESFQSIVSNAISDATNRVELTAKQVNLLAQALRDLDQRTSGIQKLPDGTTQMGMTISGEPTVVIEAYNNGVNGGRKL